MPAPKGNTNAAKPAKEKGKSFTFRMTEELTKRVKKAAKKRKMKPSPWLVEAAEEKCDREENHPRQKPVGRGRKTKGRRDEL